MASGIWHLACQTYALNLIDSQGGQNRAPQLFSSSKSFRVAKSTPSSAKLSSISKWLLKPPLLSKSALVLAPLLLLSYTQGTEALTVNTTNTIHGSAPYLTFDGGRTKATDTDTFLAIELPDGRRITPSTNTSSSTNPIRLVNGSTFNDIHMVIPSGTTTTSLNSLITQGKWGDDDGDGQGAGGITASGSISLAIKDKDGTTVSRGDALSICKAPYKVTLSSTGGSLITRYGLPNSSTFSAGSETYYIKPDPSIGICYARPNLLYGGTSFTSDAPSYAGSANIWSPDKGFLTQSTISLYYNRNFPTTGLDGLYFDLDIVGVDASQLRWTVNTSGSLNATVAWRLPNQGTNEDRWITDKSKNVTRVTLTGPRASSSQISSSSPGSLTRPSLPQAFELVGRDSNGHEVRYGFVLQKWFIHRGHETAGSYAQDAWCRDLGYRIPQIRDLTNASCVRSNGCTRDIRTGIPKSSANNYARYIGAGFFAEWGIMVNYADVNFGGYNFWTSESDGGFRYYVQNNGKVPGASIGASFYAVCTAP